MADSDPDFRRWVAAARATPMLHVLEARAIRLRGTVERVGPCPHCGGGGPRPAGKGPSDRFSVNLAKNVFRCRQCEPTGGDVIKLVMFLDGCDFLTACQTLTGMAPPDGRTRSLDVAALARLEAERGERRARDRAQSEAHRLRARRRARSLWDAGRPPHGTPAEDYLRLRGLTLPPHSLLRFHPEARLFGERTEDGAYPVLHAGPCLYAAIVGPEGRFIGLHQTWIDLSDRDGKARIADPATGELAPAKKVRGSHRGGHLDLSRTIDPAVLVIGEGIETTLTIRDEWIEAGHDLTRVGFWAALNLENFGGPAEGTVAHPTLKGPKGRAIRVGSDVPAGGALAGIPIPDSVALLYLLGDGDSDPFTTRITLARAGRRWARPGRQIRTAWPPEGMDFNTLRRAHRAASRPPEPGSCS